MNAKNKGNSFERKVSKILSERFKEKTGLDSSFRRNIDSGSFFGGSNQHRSSTYDTSKATFGDVVTPPGFKFNPECKHYKTPPSFGVLLKQENKQWDTWLGQAGQDAKNSDQQMLLIIKYNGINEFVMISSKIEGRDPMFIYKEYYAYSFESFLKEPDDFFFD